MSVNSSSEIIAIPQVIVVPTRTDGAKINIRKIWIL